MNRETVQSIKVLTKDLWHPLEVADFPFWDYDFLQALEDSQSVGARTGWLPVYQLSHSKDGKQLSAALPLYLRSNSYGEYIFDWQWAEAYQRYGMAYYPKLTSAVPFTPATGPRILQAHSNATEQTLPELIGQTMAGIYANPDISSFHCLFAPESEQTLWQSQHFIHRLSFQYHWFNKGFRDFQDFLDSFRGKRRRQVQKERRQVSETGLQIEQFTGETLDPLLADTFYQFYLSTLEKKQGLPYLTREFFQKIFVTMKDRVLLVFAKDQKDQAVAGALAFYKGTKLFGRYWGALADYRFLHFELCYYQLIDFAISQGINRFEAGAQGTHKIQRGFQPCLTHSFHHIKHPEFEHAIRQYCQQEANEVRHAIDELSHSLPFKADVDGT